MGSAVRKNRDSLNLLIHPVQHHPSIYPGYPSLQPLPPPPPLAPTPIGPSSLDCSVTACVCVFLHCVSAGTCVCVCRSLAFVILPTVSLSFIRARPAAHRLSVYSFTVSGLRLLAARGWMISNTWEPWEPTQRWNNRGPVSVGALEEDETAGGDDVRIIHTHPRSAPALLLGSRALGRERLQV